MPQDIVDRFSTHLKNVLTRALCFVVENKRTNILPEHLLWALGTEKGSIGAELLHKMHVKVERLRALVAATAANANGELPEALSPHLSEDAKRAIEKAVLTANVYEHRYVGTEHLLSGLLQVNDPALEAFFKQEKINVDDLRQQVAVVLKSTSKFPDLASAVGTERNLSTHEKEETAIATDTEDTPAEGKKTPALDYFGRDLTAPEVQKHIDPVIGREAEIDRVMEILCRRTKNNPLLLGEPGVGKTAIVEGLAKKVVEGDVPAPLRNKRFVALDLAMLIAGTMYRGEFEGRLRQIVDEVKRNPDIILFVDELHAIVGAGAASGSLDAANILKPALARGEIRCIGATTLAEFKKHIESDSALERRFQSVIVEEPTPEKTLEILRGVAPQYETYHGVRISSDALESAVRMSSRYIQDKRLPDKALDLVDEACASVRVHASEPGPVERRRMLETRMEDIREAKRSAVVEERFLDAVTLKEEEERLHENLSRAEGRPERAKESISDRDIARVVSRMTGVPLADLLQEDRAHLAHLEGQLGKRILGQAEAVRRTSEALRRAKAGLAHPNRPLASLLFLGPSGVGKTELAKAVAETVFNTPKALIRLDMSEYSEGFTVSKLVGAPAGYVGYREGAKLTDRVKQRPYGVVLFDELEKAHPDVQNLLLQILEEGEIADATGRPINFRNAVVIMTSNVGLERLERGNMGFTTGETQRATALNEDLRKELEERFRPELLNRIDQTLVFHPLTRETLQAIALKELAEMAGRLNDNGTAVEFADEVAPYLASKADPKFGARDIRRFLQSDVERVIADRLLSGERPTKLQIKIDQNAVTVTVPRKQRTRS